MQVAGNDAFHDLVDGVLLEERLGEFASYESWLPELDDDTSEFPDPMPLVYSWVFTKDGGHAYNFLRHWWGLMLWGMAGWDFGHEELQCLLAAARDADMEAVTQFLDYSAEAGVAESFVLQRDNAFAFARLVSEVATEDLKVRTALASIANYFEVDATYWILAALGHIARHGSFEPNPLGHVTGKFVRKSRAIEKVRALVQGTRAEEVLDALYPNTRIRNMVQHNDYSIDSDNRVVQSHDGTVSLSFDEVFQLFGRFQQWFFVVGNVLASTELRRDIPDTCVLWGVVSTGHVCDPPLLEVYQLLPFHVILQDNPAHWPRSLGVSVTDEAIHFGVDGTELHSVERQDISDAWLSAVDRAGELQVVFSPVVPSLLKDGDKLSLETGEYDYLGNGVEITMAVELTGL